MGGVLVWEDAPRGKRGKKLKVSSNDTARIPNSIAEEEHFREVTGVMIFIGSLKVKSNS